MLRRYLWKEAREQRTLLLALSGILTVLGVGGTLALPGDLRPGLGWWTTLGAIVGIVLLGSELVASDVRSGHLAHLARLPAVVGRAFLAKAVAYVGGVVLLAVVGALLAVVFACGRGAPELLVVQWRPVLVLALLAAGAWVLAVSCWMPRSVLVVPATALWLAMTLGPMFLVLRDHAGLDLRVADASTGLAWLTIAGVVVARMSFARCLRYPGQGTGLLRCVGLALLLLTPLWTLGGYRLWQWHHVDPLAAETTIFEGYAGRDGRLAFLTLFKSEFLNGRGVAQNVVLRASFTQDGSTASPDALCYLDAGTGEIFARRDGWEFADEHVERLRASQAAAAAMRLEDGRPVFFFRGELLAVNDDGTTAALPWPSGTWPLFARGRGLMTTDATGVWRFYDLTRRRAFEGPKGGGSQIRGGAVSQIRAGGWIVPGKDGRFRLWDPDTGVVSELPGLQTADRVGPLVDARRVLAWREQQPWIDVLEPESGERQRLRIEGGERHMVNQVSSVRPEFCTLQATPSGSPLFKIDTTAGTQLARLDGDCLAMTPIVRSVQFLNCIDDDTVLAIVDGRTLERLHFDRDEREVVFPR